MADMTTRMPALYIGHGAPPLLDDPTWSGQLAAWAADLPRPKAVLIVSAHWESAPVSLSASRAPLVYDFGGFDAKYYRMTYETPDASALARRIAALMPANEPVHQHAERGLDHGAWVPLKIMYPEADIPVLQMSLPTHDPVRLMRLGERLRPLRDEGVLVIGSGFLTHGLPFLTDWRLDATAPGMPYAHPTVEHYTPLFVTLGAATTPDEPGIQVIDGYWLGLSKRSLQVA
jgi:4,5-DOPA dioxygenase extradiol